MSKMVNMGFVNDSSKFENQILSYKQDIEFDIHYFVNKAQVLLFFTYMLYWCKFQFNWCFLLLILFMNTLNQFILFASCCFVKEIVISLHYL